MAKEIVLFAQPNYTPSSEKSIFHKLLDKGSFGALSKVEHAAESQFGRKRVSTGLELFREYTESGVAAAALGYLDGTVNMEPLGMSVDAGLALAGGIGRLIAGADSGVGKTCGDLGMTGNAVFWFRQGRKYAQS